MGFRLLHRLVVKNQENVNRDKMITQKLKKINEAIINLDFKSQLVYMYIVSKRQLNNYIIFSNMEKSGNPKIIENAINTLKESIFKDAETSKIEQLKVDIENESPDMDDFPSDLFASFALNTCSFVYECLEYLIDKNIERIDIITSTSIRSIETYIEDSLNIDENLSIEETEKIVYEQDLLKNELKFQENLVSTLYLMDKIDTPFLELVEMIEDKTAEKILNKVSGND